MGFSRTIYSTAKSFDCYAVTTALWQIILFYKLLNLESHIVRYLITVYALAIMRYSEILKSFS